VRQAGARLEVADGRFDLGEATVVGLKLQRGALPVGDERVVVVLGEQGELAAWSGPHSAHDQPGQRALLANSIV
jgi:hypothetical protein